VEKVGGGIVVGLTSAGNFLERWLTENLSTGWIPKAITAALRYPSRLIDSVDQKAYAGEESLLRQWVDVPIKTLQLIQNGDLQWYLVFAMGCVVAILIHFLRT
jgi:hypothetical protein